MPSAPVIRGAGAARSGQSASMRPTWSKALLAEAQAAGASDVHFQPGGDGLELRWRIDGVLHPVALLPAKVAPNVVARLKVLSELLTYRTDVPQEGRIKGVPGEVEMRVSTFPDLVRREGRRPDVRRRRAVSAPGRPGLARRGPRRARALAGRDLRRDRPVRSRPAAARRPRSMPACASWRPDRAASAAWRRWKIPIEAVVPGVAQAQVNPAAGLTLESGLKSLLRQDPEVIAIGEIRDKTTAEIALQAALTGHLILTTFHAGSACEVIGRFLDMGIEPYVVRSGLRAVVAQRLVRRLCDCARPRAGPTISSACPCATPGCPAAASLPRHRLPRANRAGRAALARDRRAGPGRAGSAPTSAGSSRSPSPPA